MSDDKKKRNSWFTSILIGTAIVSVAGALYVAKDKQHGGKIKAIKNFALDVIDDGKTVYKSLTIDNVKQLKKIFMILANIFKSTSNKLNITKYFKKNFKNKLINGTKNDNISNTDDSEIQ